MTISLIALSFVSAGIAIWFSIITYNIIRMTRCRQNGYDYVEIKDNSSTLIFTTIVTGFFGALAVVLFANAFMF